MAESRSRWRESHQDIKTDQRGGRCEHKGGVKDCSWVSGLSNWRQSPFAEVGLKGECPWRKSIILVQPRQVRMPLHMQVNEWWLPFPQQLFTEYPFQVSKCS